MVIVVIIIIVIIVIIMARGAGAPVAFSLPRAAPRRSQVAVASAG